MDDKFVYEWEVPKDYPNFSGFDDIAEAYRVRFSKEANGGCVIEAKYSGKWGIPFSDRPLVRHLIELIKKQRYYIEFYQQRIKVLQQWQKRLPESYRKECCDILANGTWLK